MTSTRYSQVSEPSFFITWNPLEIHRKLRSTLACTSCVQSCSLISEPRSSCSPPRSLVLPWTWKSFPTDLRTDPLPSWCCCWAHGSGQRSCRGCREFWTPGSGLSRWWATCSGPASSGPAASSSVTSAESFHLLAHQSGAPTTMSLPPSVFFPYRIRSCACIWKQEK